MIRRVSVIGLGKLGACMAAAMASRGMDVIGVDVNPRNVTCLNEGCPPVVEPHLEEMITANRSRLKATSNYDEAIAQTDASFIIVPTPSDARGSFSLDYVKQAVREIGRALAHRDGYHVVVVTSTVLPGSTQFGILPILERESGKKCGRDFGLCYNPEFIALGSVIHDLLHPDFILVGESDERAGKELEEFYLSLCDNRPPVKRMNFVNAELTKISVNTFVTTKITFANMLANICEELPGADIDVVSSALGMDTRIGRKYLTGALGYGGPCFPRDNQALSFIARMLGTPATLAEATDRMNDMLLARQAEKIRKAVGQGKTIAILGLAYKPDTGVVEESQGLALAESLSGESNKVIVYDALAMESAKQILKHKVIFALSVQECIHAADTVVVTTPAKEFRALEASDFPRREERTMLFDCWRILQDKVKDCDWIKYIPLGRSDADSDLASRLSKLWT